MSSMGKWPSQRVVDEMIFGPFFSLFFFDFGSQICTSPPTSDWHAPPAAFLVVLRPCRHKLWSCRSSVIGTWHPHTWEFSAPRFAWGSRSAFFKPCTVATGSTASNLRLGSSSDGVCPTSAAVQRLWPPSPPSATCFWVFLLFYVCVCYLVLSGLQHACVWIKFYGNICWLIDRLSLFF